MRISAIILFGLIGVLSGASAGQDDFVVTQYGGKIDRVDPMTDDDLEKVNYQVGLIVKTTYTSKLQICGGTLIHPQIVLTSAGCVSNFESVGVFAGTAVVPNGIWAEGVYRVPNSDIKIHEWYNDYTGSYDIAIIILYPGLTLGKTIGTIRLATKTDNCQSGTAWVAGYTKSHPHTIHAIPNILNYKKVTPLTNDKCPTPRLKFFKEDHQICSAPYDFQGSCSGAQGSGYAVDGPNDRYLCGVNSCCFNTCHDEPRIISYVSYFNDNGWICRNSFHLVGCENKSFYV